MIGSGCTQVNTQLKPMFKLYELQWMYATISVSYTVVCFYENTWNI